VLAEGRPASRTPDDPVVPRRSSSALVALLAGLGGVLFFVLGVVASGGSSGIASSLFLLSILAGIMAIVFGAAAKGQIRRGRAPAADRGRATAGLILGIVNVSLYVLFILLVIVLVLASGWSL
jgi:hypothetical protein